MKSLFKKIFLSNISILVRNSLNIKPIDIATYHIEKASVSDAFAWRTDNGYQTIFKFSNIIKLFYKTKSASVKIEFFDKENNFLKKVEIKNLHLSNTLIIDKKFLNIEDYGVFYVYHSTNNKFPKGDAITNKCYLGYSLDGNFYSFVHGNCLSKYKSINNCGTSNISPVKISLRNNQFYKIQKSFSEYDKNELMFCNPTNSRINFYIENKKYILNGRCAKIIKFNNLRTVTIKSNCMFLRPTIFSYKNKYFDVHHG